MKKTKNININFNVKEAKIFVKRLLQWNKIYNKRLMPWKGEKDAYKIWLSEIILQQTRVEQGLHYYQQFVLKYPTVKHLANAPEVQVFKLWEGLGYYSRCRNLIHTAKYIANDLNGKFPADYDDILKLKGIGNYTAAAIASFAYNLPYAVLDGNVFRVLSRVFLIEEPIDTSVGKQVFANIAQQILPVTKAGEYNQAIMDFGATICKPVPNCSMCFFNKHCKAYLNNTQQMLPVKHKKIVVKNRWFNYFILKCQNHYAIKQRSGKDIWQGLYEFVLLETNQLLPENEILLKFEKQYLKQVEYKLIKQHLLPVQKLTHQTIYFNFFELQLNKIPVEHGFEWVKKEELSEYPFPKTLQTYISLHL